MPVQRYGPERGPSVKEEALGDARHNPSLPPQPLGSPALPIAADLQGPDQAPWWERRGNQEKMGKIEPAFEPQMAHVDGYDDESLAVHAPWP